MKEEVNDLPDCPPFDCVAFFEQLKKVRKILMKENPELFD
jgi:hypothetical protein